MNDRPLWMPIGSVRSLLALGVLAGVGAISGFLLSQDAAGDLTKIVVGGWIANLGSVIGFYFGTRVADSTGRAGANSKPPA